VWKDEEERRGKSGEREKRRLGKAFFNRSFVYVKNEGKREKHLWIHQYT
jgi:hypothetical protein